MMRNGPKAIGPLMRGNREVEEGQTIRTLSNRTSIPASTIKATHHTNAAARQLTGINPPNRFTFHDSPPWNTPQNASEFTGKPLSHRSVSLAPCRNFWGCPGSKVAEHMERNDTP
jgi:hypothetical protein